MQFPPSNLDPARNDQSGISEIDERDFAALLDAPAVAKICWEAGLSPNMSAPTRYPRIPVPRRSQARPDRREGY